MSELILAVGDDNVRFQNLFDSMKNASTNKKGVTTISFSTDAVSTTELMDMSKTKLVGLVVWLPREKVAEAIAAGRNAAPEMTYEEALEAVKGMTLNDLKEMLDGPEEDPARLAEVNEACRVFLKDIEKRKMEGRTNAD